MSGVPPSRSPPSETGKLPRVGRYALVTQTSTGVLGPRWAAYVVEGPDQGRVVAIRRIPLGGDSRTAPRLLQAAKHSEAVRNPRLLAVLDSVKQDSELAVASEHIQGEVLSLLLRLAVLRQSPIPPPVALAIARDIIEALLAVDEAWGRLVPSALDPLHSAAHGGLAPDSVLVAAFGEGLLVDPGLNGAASVLAEFRRHPLAVPYRAPEQLAMLGAADERSDVFSLGVMLWEMLANRALFGAPDRLKHADAAALELDTTKVAEEIRSRPAPDLAAVQRPGAPIRLEVRQLVGRALAREPEARFGGLREFAAALRALSGESVGTPEQVASTVDRLARSLMDARKAAIEGTAGGLLVDSMPPPSSKATDRPEPPSHPITVLMSADMVPAKPIEVPRPSGGFDISELGSAAGLRRLAELPPATVRVGPQPSPPPELTIEEAEGAEPDALLGMPSGSPAPDSPLPGLGRPPAELPSSATRLDTPLFVSAGSPAELPASELAARPSNASPAGRRLGIGAALGVGLVVASIVLVLAFMRSRGRTSADVARESPDAGAAVGAPAPSIQLRRADEQSTQVVPAASPDAGEAHDQGGEAQADESAEPSEGGENREAPRTAPGSPPASPDTKSGPRKVFRPSGI